MSESRTLAIIIAFLIFVTIGILLIFDNQEIEKESEENIPEDRFEKIEEWSSNSISHTLF